jgi:hypothetical protein
MKIKTNKIQVQDVCLPGIGIAGKVNKVVRMNYSEISIP